MIRLLFLRILFYFSFVFFAALLFFYMTFMLPDNLMDRIAYKLSNLSFPDEKQNKHISGKESKKTSISQNRHLREPSKSERNTVSDNKNLRDKNTRKVTYLNDYENNPYIRRARDSNLKND